MDDRHDDRAGGGRRTRDASGVRCDCPAGGGQRARAGGIAAAARVRGGFFAMKGTGIYGAVLLATVLTSGHGVAAQPAGNDPATLRSRIEQRFEILPLREGVVLRPRDASRPVRSIEVTGGPVAVDGQPATGAELRDKLGGDAGLVLQLSYLSDADRRALFSTPADTRTAPDSRSIEPQREPRVSRSEERRRRRAEADGDRVRIGGSVTVDEGEIVEGDVVAIGGSARISGEVHGDVVAVGGGVVLGPNASVTN